MLEQWKDISEFKGKYQVSNFGKIKSLKRKANHRYGTRAVRERILKPGISTKGYQIVILCDIKKETKRVHQLVWDAFGDKKRNGMILQVDHIDENKQNNRIDNLQLLNNRQNVSKGFSNYPSSSKYVGVSWHKPYKKWRASIQIDGKYKHLGYFDNEFKAHLAYQERLKWL